VIDHCGELKTVLIVGLPEFEALLRHLDSGRAWMKVCSYRASFAEAHWTDVAAKVKVLVAAAPDRCLWSADWPHAQMNPTPEARVPLDQFLELVPDITVRPEILVEIPALSYGF
jgi:predicted TIM-barrel fold metal-dependent hydrolase